jgi:hypothetical protein
MDPITVLSVTANIAQFVDLSARLVSTARAVYISGAGTTDRVQDLRRQMKALQDLAARAPTLGTGDTGTPDELALVELSGRANELAQEMEQLLIPLEMNRRKSKIEAMRIALKSTFKQSAFDVLEQKIARCRADLMERWVLMAKFVVCEISTFCTRVLTLYKRRAILGSFSVEERLR